MKSTKYLLGILLAVILGIIIWNLFTSVNIPFIVCLLIMGSGLCVFIFQIIQDEKEAKNIKKL